MKTDYMEGRHMKIKLLIISTVILTLCMIASCDSGTKTTAMPETTAPTVTDASSASETKEETKPSTTTASSAATSAVQSTAPAGTTAETTKQYTQDDELFAILGDITYLEEGTAGSSLRQAAAAGSVLDWVESSALSQDDIEEQISFYLALSGNSNAADMLASNFAGAAIISQEIIDGDTNTIGSLTDAGYTLQHTAYTQSKWDAFVIAVQVTTDAY